MQESRITLLLRPVLAQTEHGQLRTFERHAFAAAAAVYQMLDDAEKDEARQASRYR